MFLSLQTSAARTTSLRYQPDRGISAPLLRVTPRVFGQNFRARPDAAVGVMGKKNARLNLRLDPPEHPQGPRVRWGNKEAIKIRWPLWHRGHKRGAGLGKLSELFWEPVDGAGAGWAETASNSARACRSLPSELVLNRP